MKTSRFQIFRPALIFLFLLPLCLLPGRSVAQRIVCSGENCGSFDTIIREAEKAIAGKKYSIAIRLYNAARVCCPAAQTAIDDAVERTFAAIDQQRIDAQNASVREKKAKNTALEAKLDAEKAQRAAEKSSKANRLAALALKNAKSNPTLGLHLANLAWQAAYDSTLGYCTEPGVTAVLHDIISDEESWMFHPFKGHTAGVNDAEFSPDGTRVVTASNDYTAMIWDTNGRPLDTLRGHKDIVKTAVYSPDGKYILTVSEDSTAGIWDKNGVSLHILKLDKAKIKTAEFSPDGQKVLTCSDKAILWNVETGDTLKGNTFAIHNGNPTTQKIASVQTVLFSPDGRYILTAAKDSQVLMYKNDGRFIRLLKNNFTYPSIIRISPNGKQILTYDSPDKGIFVLRDTLFMPLDTIAVLGGVAVDAAFSPNGRFIVFAFNSGHIQVWKNGKSTITYNVRTPYYGKILLRVAGNKDNMKIVLNQGDRQLFIYNEEGTLIRSFEAHTNNVSSLACSRDGTKIITASSDKTARIWSKNSVVMAGISGTAYARRLPVQFSKNQQQILAHFDQGYGIYSKASNQIELLEIPASKNVLTVDYAPNGMIIAGCTDSSVLILNAAGKLLHTIEHCIVANRSAFMFPLSEEKGLITIGDSMRLWNYQGRWLKTFQLPKLSQVIAVPNAERFLVLNPANAYIVDIQGNIIKVLDNVNYLVPVTFSDDGERFFTANSDEEYYYSLWDKNGKKLHARIMAFQPVFSPDHTVIYTITIESKIGRLGINGDSLSVLPASNVTNLIVSPKGKYLLYSTGDGSIWIAHKDGRPIRKIDNHTGEFNAICFSPDDQYLVTFAKDFSIRCWNISKGVMNVWEGHNSSVERAFFSPDGQYLISAATGGILKMWEVKTGNQLRTIRMPLSHTVTDIVFSQDNDLIVASDNFGKNYLIEGLSFYLNNHRQISVADLVKANAGLDTKEVLQKATADEVAEVAEFYFDRQDFDIAQLYFTQAEQRQHRSSSLIYLDIIARKHGTGLDLQKFASDEQPDNLCAYGKYFYDQAKLDTARLLFERAEKFAHTFTALYYLKSIAERKRQKFDAQRFLFLQQPADLEAAGDEADDPVIAAQLFEKSEQLHHSANVLLKIENIAWQNKQPFDYQRFLRYAPVGESLRYADRLYRRERWEEAYTLYQRAIVEAPNPTILYNIYSLSQKLKKPFDTSTFLASVDQYQLLDYAHNLDYSNDWELLWQIYHKADNIAPLYYEDLSRYYTVSLHLNKPFNKKRFYESDDTQQLYNNAKIAFNSQDWETCRLICQKWDSISPDPAIKVLYSLIEIKKGKRSHFDEAVAAVKTPEILLELAELIKPDTLTIANFDLNSKYIFALENQALQLDTSRDFHENLANEYNSLAYTKLTTVNEADLAEKLIRRGIVIAPDFAILYTNLPPALLLQGRFEEAKKEYLKYKDIKYTGSGSDQFPTFKEAFLDDFNTIEERGVHHPDIARIRAILNGEPDPGRKD